MVQLTFAAEGQVEVAPPVSHVSVPAYFVPVDQLPNTSLVSQQVVSGEGTPSQFSPFPESIPDSGCETPCHKALLTSVPGSLLPSETYLSPDMANSNLQAHSFTAFGSIDSLPVTVLGSESQTAASDLSGDGGKTFEVIPVSERCHRVLDNAQPDRPLCAENILQNDTRTDSVDSLAESRGYCSDSSDVYMNSDYTDTVTSADSGAFLLPAEEPGFSNSKSSVVNCVESSASESNFYNNQAFSADSRKELITWSSDVPVLEKTEEDTSANSSCEARHWEVSVPEEDTGAMAYKEEEEEDQENTQLVPPQTRDTLENLVNHLAEQHPEEVVDIRIEVLDQPVYSPVTEPLEDMEHNWLQSTDSLHHYKLLKQGRATTMNSLHIHALSNLRANTMNNLHERSSFLNLTAASVSNLGNACQKALSYVRADMEFGSMMSLRTNAFSSSLLPGKDQPPHDLGAFSSEKKVGQSTVESGCHTRNVLYMALLVTILLISVNTTRNLQSSLNQEGGVGIICLAVMFASYTLGSLLSPVLVQGQGVKACVVSGLVLQLLYVAANLYPVMWLMLPASLGGGASLALIWNAMSTYIVLLARGESNYRQKSYQRVSDKFFGIFCLIYQSNLIIGNLIASLVLTFAAGEEGSTPVAINGTDANSTSLSPEATTTALSSLQEVAADFLGTVVDGNGIANGSLAALMPFDATTESHYHLCGSAYCHHFVVNKDSSAVPERTVYLLFGIFMLLVVGAILIAVFLLEPLSPRPFSSSTPPWHSIKRQILSLVKFSRNAKFLLMLPLLLYSTMQFSFVCSEVMMAYVTCPVGVWLVGYTMIGYGVSCSMGSYITQALVPRVGRGSFICLATALNVGLLVFMRLWQPHPDSVLPLFIITTLLGFTDGIWNVNANGLCGSVFPDHYEEAFTGLRMAQGLGGAFSMAYAPFFCMAVKIYVMIGGAILVLAGYLGAEVLIRRDSRQKKDILFEKEIV